MQLGQIAEKLDAMGVKTLGVVATDAERARVYFRYRKPRMPMGSDPDLSIHRAYGVPNVGPPTPEVLQAIERAAARELGGTGSVPAGAVERFGRHDGYEPSEADQADGMRHGGQLVAQFLLDRDGIVRWVNVECAREGLEGIGKLPSEDEVLEAARALR